MKYDVELFDYRTNYRRNFQMEHEGSTEVKATADECMEFNWGENNMSDDCNRTLYLYDQGRAENTPIPPDLDGCTHFIKCRITNLGTGAVVLDELS